VDPKQIQRIIVKMYGTLYYHHPKISPISAIC